MKLEDVAGSVALLGFLMMLFTIPFSSSCKAADGVLAINRTLYVGHPMTARDDLNETENDAWVLKYYRELGQGSLVLGYGRMRNSFYEPSQLYSIGAGYGITNRLGVQVGIAGLTGYGKQSALGKKFLVAPAVQFSYVVGAIDNMAVAMTGGVLGNATTAGIELLWAL